MSAPTPTPWRWWTSNSHVRLSSEATGKDGDVLCAVSAADGLPVVRVSQADAALIVRAVNAHGALVDALYEVLAAHQRGGPHPEDSCSNCTLARAALALAKEKP